MTGSNKHMLVPQLRFPEFRNAEEWTTYNLGQLSKIVTERVGDDDCIPYTITSGVGLISQQEKLGRTIAGNSLKNYILLQHNDFAYNKSATKAYPQGYIACYQGHERAAVPNSIFTCFRPALNLVIPAFLDNLFIANLHGKWLKNRVAVGARANGALQINNDDLMKVPVPLPTGSQSLSEQKKIADCLSSLDDLLTAEVQKLDTLKKYKQGLMQQLFPREGESVPRLRFPEFQSEGEWVYEKIGDCLEKVIDYRGKAPPKAESGVQLITAKNVRFGWLDMSCNEYISADEYESWMSKGIPRVGDILFTTEAPLGNVAFFPCTGKFALGQRIITLRTKPKKCLAEFLFQALLTPDMQKKIDFHSTGSTAKGIKSKVFVNLSFCYPKISEQQKIAEVLSSLDNFIAAQSQKLDVLKNHKKGLMQQLFPVFDEILA
ncbi:TPA: restriction endonuclease subunit S [Serratia marcescens]|uniref:Type I restriction-modification enzyme, S subunit n=1 Tax=Serratia marcescens SM39 TaxID=1334564 RepID=A0AAT9EYC7_SERMA|nr:MULTISPECIES: restriction endonuclease subunit S [Enterobacterales]AXO38962.1 restriction endonuclease subunit S [Enterobacter hormaechei]MBH3117301.1 restriction endonuclease subunit S [Serratia ureilytica]MBH3262349.1 restriction endonuclease subunit S [Serratia marcescens]MBS6088757.1 restriction endonuclease subunit S [Serratia marcescens]MCJ1029994.1 restriction endonuclease subunit S [Escherichia coli]